MSDTHNIENLDQFAGICLAWHENRMKQLQQVYEIPDDVELLFSTTGNPEDEKPLTPEQRVGFLAGIVVARDLFQKLPFSITATDPEQDALEQEISDANS